MRILVAGRHGQLAQALRAAAPTLRDCEMIFRGRPQLDIRDPAPLQAQLAAIAPDIVINAAAFTDVDLAEAEPEAAFRINAEGAGNLARAAAAVGAAIIQVSTDYVFSGDASAPYVETDRTGPLNVYGRSKLAGEVAVLQANPRSIVARTAWLFGPGDGNFLARMLQLGASQNELRIVGDQFGSPTYAQDLAQALVTIAAAIDRAPENENIWGTYHVTNSDFASWHALATAIFAAASKYGFRQPHLTKISSEEYPMQAPRPAYTVLNNEKYCIAFATRIRNWQDAVEECVQRIFAARSAAPR